MLLSYARRDREQHEKGDEEETKRERERERDRASEGASRIYLWKSLLYTEGELLSRLFSCLRYDNLPTPPSHKLV